MVNEENSEPTQTLNKGIKPSPPAVEMGEIYPKEAMKPGTYVRVNRLSRLGLIDDAFYGALDEDENRIIIYTIVLLPVNARDRYNTPEEMSYALTNEYEYEVTGFLMIKPVDMEKLNDSLSGRQ
tara:strand:+ start:5358 stop:5729 length:372 start_codon:yes stop_codon:yes gene_type:complete